MHVRHCVIHCEAAAALSATTPMCNLVLPIWSEVSERGLHSHRISGRSDDLCDQTKDNLVSDKSSYCVDKTNIFLCEWLDIQFMHEIHSVWQSHLKHLMWRKKSALLNEISAGTYSGRIVFLCRPCFPVKKGLFMRELVQHKSSKIKCGPPPPPPTCVCIHRVELEA